MGMGKLGLGCECCSPCPDDFPLEWFDDFSTNTISDYEVFGNESAAASVTGGRLRLDHTGTTTVGSADRTCTVRKSFIYLPDTTPEFVAETELYFTEPTNLSTKGNNLNPILFTSFALFFGASIVASAQYTISRVGAWPFGPFVTTRTFRLTIFEPAGLKTVTAANPTAGDVIQIRAIKLAGGGANYSYDIEISINGTIQNSSSASKFQYPAGPVCSARVTHAVGHDSSVDPNGVTEYDNFTVWQE